jgi:hypothetical protein
MSYRPKRRAGMGAYSGPIFLNQCRTKDNINGWVPGTGDPSGVITFGSGQVQPYLQTYASLTDPTQIANYDALLANADALHAQGITCPSSAAAIGPSPFLPGSGYVAPKSPDTPLLPTWSGGFMTDSGSGQQAKDVTGGSILDAIVGTPAPPQSAAAQVVSQAQAAQQQLPTTPAGATIINSSGATVPAAADSSAAASSSGGLFANFSFSSLPWYVWAGVAGLGLYAIGGGGSGRGR